MIPLNWYLTLSAVVFMIGVFGFLTRRNIVIMFMSVELMLNGINISLISFSHYLQDMRGQVLVFFIITVAAAEAALAIRTGGESPACRLCEYACGARAGNGENRPVCFSCSES